VAALSSSPKALSRANLKQEVELHIKHEPRPNTGKEELTSTSGTKALTLSFEAPTPLLGLTLAASITMHSAS
jgi:hypothetical protein